MKKDFASSIMLSFLLVGILMMSSRISLTNVAGQLEPMDALVPYVPETNQVELNYREDNDTSYIDVSITFGSTGYSVSDWGTTTIVGNDISANAEIWVWTGISLPVVVTKYHTYNLGNLTAGEYIFTFEAWECSVRNITFTVEKSKLLLEADKPVYKLGEDVITTITNISNETIPWVGRWPVPWDIFTHPENRCVFAAFPCYCIFELPPGENVSYTWNQSDMFTIAPVEPGTYEVRDNQEWGLSIFFKIVDAEIIVPDDYPTIQEAINNANEGDSIFVRNGTYYENVVVNKTVSLIGENISPTIIDGGSTRNAVNITAGNVSITGFTIQKTGEPFFSGCGIYVSSDGNNISYNLITKSDYGIWLYNSSCNVVFGNNILFNIFDGIYLHDCSGNTIFGNTVSSIEYDGIWLVSSNNNTVSGNSVFSNTGYGIWLMGSDNCTISDNIVRNNTNGIYLEGSSSNVVSGNTVSSGIRGITLRQSDNCAISNNIASNNTEGISVYFYCTNNTISGNIASHNDYGICLVESSDNRVFHNNFVENTRQTDIFESTDVWDNGCEGNYWTNYNGTDLDGDGIGDTYLPWEGVDNYPLMNPYWNPADVNHDLKVNIYDAVLICAAYSSTPSDPHWNPHCDIAEPYGIIDIYDVVMMAGSYGEEHHP